MFFRRNKIAHAVALAAAGTALSLGAISNASATATTMYNLTKGGGADNSGNTTNPTTGSVWALAGATDGWTNGPNTASTGTGTNTGGAKWAGTTGVYNTPFGYVGAHLNWGLSMTGYDTAEISTFDAFSRYGVYADIDTAKGAWSDVAEPLSQGWRHDLDIGLFKSDVGGWVTLSAQGAMLSGTNFGFTIFKGMDTVTDYSHHGGWNAGSNESGLTAVSVPWVDGSFGGTPLSQTDIVAYSVGGTTPSRLNTITFYADPGQVYTIVIGGYRQGTWDFTNDGYRLTVSASSQPPVPKQVPVPQAALWLLGAAFGIVGPFLARRFGRNKH